MDFNLNFHPLDNLIKDKSIIWLEALVPFIDYRFKKYLIIYIKYKELTYMLEALEDKEFLCQCGFNCKAGSIDDVINGLAGFMPKDFSDNIIQMKNMMNMMQAMNQMEQSDCNKQHHHSQTNNFGDISNIMNMFGADNKSNMSSHDDDMFNSVMSILDQY